ncbi:LacI family transcriptional regulator [Agromyces rhizosphaerae]|uniref:LacI family transcriptional regulator n=1 Tax=Agromyces rhizosphaerae TaxID=88374 RepID=A0A9W6CV77_9MICO|nr:LacI family DNA-binding transcriptional regulator [Agromyces rhizosphaerae]GLI26676.1 LacI family transcriptional regulator [Agromyces rhizosphaerae]
MATDASGSAGTAAGEASVPTMFDVARLAGVSHQTVSRVLNGRADVAEATRARVQQAIADLHYTPSPAARAMASRRSRSLGLILAGRPDYGPSSAALEFNQAAYAAGYTVSQVSMRSLQRSALREAVRRLVAQRVEAIVLISGEREAVEVVGSVDVRVPVVAVASEPVSGVRRVAIDQAAGARAAVEHLVGLGHREIRHVAGPHRWMDATERVRGWREAMASHGLRVAPPIEGEWLPDSGYAAGVELAADATATAVFVGNDQMALGLLHALRDAGRRVPDDLSVVGFDDEPEAAHFAPPLTTLRQDFDALGRDTMSLVAELLAGPGASASQPASVDDPAPRAPSLIVRASTAPPPRA